MMGNQQQAIEIAAEFYKARDMVIGLTGEDSFKYHVEKFRPILSGICKQKKITEMQATIDILETLKGRGHETLLAMAACAEIMEPTEQEASNE